MTQYFGMGAFVPLHAQNVALGSHQGFGQIAGLPVGGIASLNQIAHHYGNIGLNNIGTILPTTCNPYAGLGYFGTPAGWGVGTQLTAGNIGGSWNNWNNPGARTALGFVPGNPIVQNFNGGSFGSLPVGISTQASLQGLNTLTQGNGSLAPALATELSETSQDYILSFDVPGIEAQNLEVSFAGNTFYLNGSRHESQETKALAYSEVAKGIISRSITVPFEVTPQRAINTSLENGVLKIRISKENEGAGRTNARKIKIG